MTLLFLVVGVLGMITPHGVRMIRGVFNDTVVDVMYYMSSRFGPEVGSYKGTDLVQR